MERNSLKQKPRSDEVFHLLLLWVQVTLMTPSPRVGHRPQNVPEEAGGGRLVPVRVRPSRRVAPDGAGGPGPVPEHSRGLQRAPDGSGMDK